MMINLHKNFLQLVAKEELIQNNSTKYGS